MKLVSLDLQYTSPGHVEHWLNEQKADIYCFQRQWQKKSPTISHAVLPTFARLGMREGHSIGLQTYFCEPTFHLIDLGLTNHRPIEARWFEFSCKGGLQWNRVNVGEKEIYVLNLLAQGGNTTRRLYDMQTFFEESPVPMVIVGEILPSPWRMSRDETIIFLKNCGLKHYGMSIFARGVKLQSLDAHHLSEKLTAKVFDFEIP